MFADCIAHSFRLPPLAAWHPGGSSVGGRENKQRGIRCWWTEDGKHICQQVGGQFERTGNMVHGLIRIVAHDERIRGERFCAVGTRLLQARDPGETELVMVHNEHLAVSYTNPFARS